MGRDELDPEDKRTDETFQSTRPRGARQKVEMLKKYLEMFQSTRPRGARLIDGVLDCREIIVSIHAPAWGATAFGSSLVASSA